MKFNQSLKLSASVLLLSGTAFSLHGQTELLFNLPGDDGFVNENPVTASGKVILDGVNVTLELTNGPHPSEISRVWLLKPVDGSGQAIDAATLDAGVASPTGWGLLNSLTAEGGGNPTSILKNDATWVDDDYFGAFAPGQSDRLDSGNTLVFSFVMNSAPVIDWSGLESKSAPSIAVRWQTVNADGKGSSAGFAYFYTDIPTTPVPEPRLIAPLAVLGLGGLLYTRRRIKAKKAVKA